MQAKQYVYIIVLCIILLVVTNLVDMDSTLFPLTDTLDSDIHQLYVAQYGDDSEQAHVHALQTQLQEVAIIYAGKQRGIEVDEAQQTAYIADYRAGLSETDEQALLAHAHVLEMDEEAYWDMYANDKGERDAFIAETLRVMKHEYEPDSETVIIDRLLEQYVADHESHVQAFLESIGLSSQ